MNNKFKYLSIVFLFLAFCTISKAQTCTTISTVGTTVWTCPAGVTSVTVQCWGGGGAGGGIHATSASTSSGGGAGGSYASSVIAVVAGNNYNVVVGAGGTAVTGGAGGAGGTSSFNGASVVAVGGAGAALATNGNGTGATGSSAGNTGTTVFAGGSSTAGNTGLYGGGGGGGAAGTTAAGGSASNSTGGTGGTSGGGSGSSFSGFAGNGVAGTAPGGGGSGAWVNFVADYAGGAGGAGQVILCYCTPCSGVTSPTAGGATASVISGCTSYTSVISLNGSDCNGVTYQWQSSTDNITYANIPGATSSTYTATVNSSTYYQCIIKCTTSGLSSPSSPAYCQLTCNGGVAVATGSACSGSYTPTLSLTGVTGCSLSYQWQSSPDGTTWTNIGGATSSTAAPTVSANTYYHCVVTCSGGNTSTSAPVFCAYQATSNDNCSNAYNIPTSNLNGTWNTGFSLACASYDNSHTCNNAGAGWAVANEWFTFTAQGPDLEITALSGGFNPYITLFSGNACGSLSYVTCAVQISYNNGYNAGASYVITPGTQYYIMISNGASSYSLQVNNPLPNPNQTNCSTAQILCSGGSYGGAANLWGTQELTTSTLYGCNLNEEINSSWYILNVLTGGTLTFTLSPADGVDDYDYALYSSNDCNNLGAPVSCSYSSVLGVTGISSSAGGFSNSTNSGGITWNKDYTVSPGVYILYVNGFTPSSEGFNFTLGGTAVLGCTYPIVLPVELLSFTADYIKTGDVNVKWNTASEVNCRYFTVEKSKDGIHYTAFARVDGAGNSNHEIKYELTDTNPYAGTSYYRLKQTDVNGQTKYFDAVAVSVDVESTIFKVRPNPVVNTAEVEYNCTGNEVATLRIFDSQGFLVSETNYNCTTGKNSSTVNFEEMPQGLYILTLSTSKTVYKAKVLK